MSNPEKPHFDCVDRYLGMPFGAAIFGAATYNISTALMEYLSIGEYLQATGALVSAGMTSFMTLGFVDTIIRGNNSFIFAEMPTEEEILQGNHPLCGKIRQNATDTITQIRQLWR